ncbi:SDR family oxidoreductase [Paraburkholderia hayleyella]|uniref:SDR family oxidoreductase n=1 Tax=Paraburkholderia hayleyella TaxID=2152889 RepID=UPI00129258D8|nr:SDR family oxidoreductase [Paraburkholderia hayleyella]
MTSPSSRILITRAVVTGHTRGLGAALAEQLLSREIAVLGLSRSRNAALANRYGTRLSEIELDLAHARHVAQWAARDDLRRFIEGAHCVMLLNNAGTVQPVGPLGAQAPEAIAQAVELNVATPLILANALVAASAHGVERRIAHISSGAGRHAYAGWSIYCATKAALDHHAQTVALDQNPTLRISSIAPGVVDTAMQAEIRGASTAQFPLREKFDELKRSGQLATPEDTAAKLVAYLLSETFGQMPVADIREIA